MASTASGWQYPQAADPIASYPPVAQSVSEKLETAVAALRMASGAVSMPGLVTTVESVAVTFPAGRFTAAPRLALSTQSTDPSARLASVGSISTGGCTIYGVKTAGGAYGVHWIAVGA